MMFFILLAVLITDGAHTSEDSCDLQELKFCVDATPRTQIGLPKNKDELDNHCALKAYHTGMKCMDTWIKRCLPTDGQKIIQQQIGGARALMRYLCSNDTALRRDFLKEPSCWLLVSTDWSRCVDELQLAAREISERSNHIVYFNKNAELCCARDAFLSCVSRAGRACSASAGALLRRMAWVLAQDVAACSQQSRAYCSAPVPLQRCLPLLTALTGILLYPLVL
nr:uncharacterized protein LOC116769792 [Danaus plexippus plexippus]